MRTLLRRGLTLATGVALALAVTVTPIHAAEAQPKITIKPKAASPTWDVYGYTYNLNSHKAIAVLVASHADGAPVIQYPRSLEDPTNDLMLFEWQGGSNWFRIKPQHSQKCLATEGASAADNAFVNQYTCTYDNNLA